MDLDRLGGVRRATRLESARRGPPGTRRLVEVDQPTQRPGDQTGSGRRDRGEARHRDKPALRRWARAVVSATSSTRSGQAKVANSAPPPTRYRPPARRSSSTSSRHAARRRRRIRLRSTAPPARRPTLKPTSAGRPGPAAQAVTTNGPPRARHPCRPRRAKRSRPRRRQRATGGAVPVTTPRRGPTRSAVAIVRPRAACGPWRAASARWPYRPDLPFGGGSRAAWPGGGCWAGTYASRVLLVPPAGLGASGGGRPGARRAEGLGARSMARPSRAPTRTAPGSRREKLEGDEQARQPGTVDEVDGT